VEEYRAPVLVRLVRLPGLTLLRFDEASVLALEEEPARHAVAAADVDIVETVAVHVADGERGTMPREHVWKERLDRVVDRRRLFPRVSDAGRRAGCLEWPVRRRRVSDSAAVRGG